MIEYPKTFKDYIEDLVNYWKPKLLLHHYDISFKYQDKQKANVDTDAAIIVSDRYLQGTITIFPQLLKAWKEKNYKDIENTIVHEICHIITDNLFMGAHKYSPEIFHDLLDHENEKLVQMITNIFISMKEKGKL